MPNKGHSFASRVKGPLKYLVAKLHGCYPRAISLPVSQNIFARFFSAPTRRRFKSQVTVFFFTSLQQRKKNFSFTVLLINFLLYGFNTWVVPIFFKLQCFAWKCYQRTDVNKKPKRWLHVDEEISNSWRKFSTGFLVRVRLGIEILKMPRHKLELVLRYHHPQTLKNSEFAAFLAAPKLPYVFYDKTVRPCMWTCIRELSFRTWETTNTV